MIEELVWQPANNGLLHQAGGGLDEFDAAEDRAGLVLPAAAGGEHLLQRRRAREQGVAVPVQSAQVTERGEDRCRENAAGAQARAFGHGSEQGNFNAGAEVAELLLQRSKPAIRVKPREEAGECERRFGQRERAVVAAQGIQFSVGAHALFDAEVYRAHYQFGPLGEFGKDLDWGLAVEVGGHVEHFAAVLDAVRRSVGPAARQVKPDRTSRPDDLVVQNVAARAGWRESRLVDDHLPEPGEGARLELFPPRLSAMPQDGGTEHLIVHQLHGIIVIGKCKFRQRLAAGREGLRGRLEVEPEEDAPAEVLEHRDQAGLAQPRPLLIKPAQVHLLRDLLRGKPRQLAPTAGEVTFAVRCRRKEPLDEGRLDLTRGKDGEQGTGMDVGLGSMPHSSSLRPRAANQSPAGRPSQRVAASPTGR